MTRIGETVGGVPSGMASQARPSWVDEYVGRTMDAVLEPLGLKRVGTKVQVYSEEQAKAAVQALVAEFAGVPRESVVVSIEDGEYVARMPAHTEKVHLVLNVGEPY